MVVAMLVIVGMVVAAEAATYTVGGAGGWTFNVATWPKGKRFRAGDTLGAFKSFLFFSLFLKIKLRTFDDYD